MKKERTRKINLEITQGSIKSSLFKLSLPLLAGAFLHNLFTLVDLFFIGRLGSAALAALSVAGVILAIIIMAALGISAGTTALITHYSGKKEYQNADRVLFQSIILSLVWGLIMLVIGLFWIEPLLKLIGTTPEIMPHAAQYLKIAFLFSFLIFLFFAFNQALRGTGDAITPLKGLILANIINIILDPLLIFGIGFFPRLEVAGSALATVISRGIGLLFIIKHLFFGYSSLHINRKMGKINLPILGRMIKIGFFSSLEALIRQISYLLLIGLVAAYGTASLAAYGIVVKLKFFIIMFGLSIGIAASIIIGQSMGSNQPQRAQYCGWQAVKYYQFLVLPISVIFFIFAPEVITFFSKDQEVVALATNFLRYISVSMPFLTPALILGKGITGAGDTAAPASFTTIFQLAWKIPAAYLIAKTFSLGVTGVYIAISLADFFQGLAMALYFQKKNWQKKYYRHRIILEKGNFS